MKNVAGQPCSTARTQTSANAGGVQPGGRVKWGKPFTLPAEHRVRWSLYMHTSKYLFTIKWGFFLLSIWAQRWPSLWQNPEICWKAAIYQCKTGEMTESVWTMQQWGIGSPLQELAGKLHPPHFSTSVHKFGIPQFPQSVLWFMAWLWFSIRSVQNHSWPLKPCLNIAAVTLIAAFFTLIVNAHFSPCSSSPLFFLVDIFINT